MTTCNSRCSLWTLVFVGLLFAAFIGGTQFPIQFTIGKRTENVPVTLAADQPVTSAGFNTPAVPTTVAFNDVVTPNMIPPVVEMPITQPPALNTTPTSIPPAQESNVPSMPPAVSPPSSMALHPEPLPTPIPLPQVAVTKGNDPEQIPPPGPAPERPEPASLEGKQLEECCLTKSIKSNLDFLKGIVAKKATVENNLAEWTMELKLRLSQATDELNGQDAASGNKDAPGSQKAESIDQLLNRVKQLRANKTMLEGQMSTLNRVIGNQFDELKKQVTDMGVVDVPPPL